MKPLKKEQARDCQMNWFELYDCFLFVRTLLIQCLRLNDQKVPFKLQWSSQETGDNSAMRCERVRKRHTNTRVHCSANLHGMELIEYSNIARHKRLTHFRHDIRCRFLWEPTVKKNATIKYYLLEFGIKSECLQRQGEKERDGAKCNVTLSGAVRWEK